MFRRAHGCDEIVDGAAIFDTRCALNTAANVHSVRCGSFDRAGNILRVQTAGENEKSRKSQGCSRSRPVARLASAAAKLRMMCINKHITMGKQRHVFRAKLRVRRKHSNHAELVGELAR